ncbi:GrpE protein [Tepidicaulis marinus]|jgi:molecular chaperone GrpE|uniref:Protein GrpE n=1 Tax=Tepidicaulis marinus TaxID=1333998 RepID=A0A081B6T8_9HYPH|nr:nucleotide exchange factor GrpE [Tepidicaulis marinus]GAK43756.1 GrpE protein [Tepidicaulis marinus]
MSEEKPAKTPSDDTPQENGEGAPDAGARMGAEAAAAVNEDPSILEGEEGGKDADALEAELAETKDRLLRLAAELENTRRRAEREKQDAARYGAASFARDVLSVADNLRRAIDAVPEEERANASAIIEGVEMTERALHTTFERHGIKPIAPQPGDKFDANFHEAMFEIPNTGLPSGAIVQVVETGYMIGDRLLRAARVGLAKGEAGGNGGGAGGKVDTTV